MCNPINLRITSWKLHLGLSEKAEFYLLQRALESVTGTGVRSHCWHSSFESWKSLTVDAPRMSSAEKLKWNFIFKVKTMPRINKNCAERNVENETQFKKHETKFTIGNGGLHESETAGDFCDVLSVMVSPGF